MPWRERRKGGRSFAEIPPNTAQHAPERCSSSSRSRKRDHSFFTHGELMFSTLHAMSTKNLQL